VFLTDQLREDEPVYSELASARRLRLRVHPLTWIGLVAAMPLLGWDVWQTLQDVKHRHEAPHVRSLTTERLPTAFD
jgi:hypothetical protein